MFELITLTFAVLAIIFQSTVYSGLAIAFSLFAVDGHFKNVVLLNRGDDNEAAD